MAKISFRKAADKILFDQKKDRPQPLTIGQLMKETLRKQRELIKDAMFQFPYFVTWSEDAYKEAVAISTIKEYKPDEIIYGYHREKSNYVYFLMEGTAYVLQRLRVEMKTIFGKNRYKLHNPISSDESKPENDNKRINKKNIEDVFMQVCIMTKGECFGIGQELKNNSVIAKTPVKCLLIPRYVLFNHDYANKWSSIEQFLSSRLPSINEIFEHFKHGRKWVEYREILFKNCQKMNSFHKTTLHDAPYHWRVNCIDTLHQPKIRVA